MTAEQVREARAAGRAAGLALAPPLTNPYAPPHVPPWQQPRTAAARTEADRQNRPARILAGVWRRAYQAGLAEYGRQRGLPPAE